MLRALRQRWHARREAAAVARRPIADDLWKRTLVRYPFLRRRDPVDAAELRRLTSLFLDRKEFDARAGVRLTNDVVVAVAAQACLPVLRLGLHRYDAFVGIVLVPGAVKTRRSHVDDDGVVHEYDDVILGEAMDGGPMLLSWHDVRSAGRAAAPSVLNVVIHEFAHVLDMANGASDGVPLLPPDLPPSEWIGVLEADHAAFAERVDADEAADREPTTTLDPYGAVGLDEFFAVASEAFFVAPEAMKREHPALYGVFVRFYRQDPAAEMPAAR
jgi:MtfA peptidase